MLTASSSQNKGQFYAVLTGKPVELRTGVRMEPDRPDPDALLAIHSPAEPDRGILKVFLGYAAGVGKTFAMLQAASSAISQGRDVVVGWFEPHRRPETTLQLAGIHGVPPMTVTHGTLQLREMNLDACLSRRPEVVLVDELAHTNAPGVRHEKRWQDVEELRDAGIEVWTTLNIQHLDSMNDIVARITGVLVQETVPDRIFDSAQEVEIVDVDPEDLIDRLRQGKIYGPDQASRALGGFFKKDNLLVLRELTLRRAADRVGREVDSARTRGQIQAIWPVRERLMVSVGPSPLSADLLRHAARLAQSLGAQLLAVYIETPTLRVMAQSARNQLEKNLAVAEALGAETVVLRGEEVARDLVAYARRRNVTKLVLGKANDRPWYLFWRRTIGDDLLRLSSDIDVYVLSGRKNPEPKIKVKTPRTCDLPWREFGWSTLIQAGFTGLGVVFESWGMVDANLILTLLLSVVVSAGLFGLAASVFSSVLAVLAFNFFFTEPRYSFSVNDPQYYLVFLFLLVVGTVIGTLAQRLRQGVLASREREQRMESLNRMHRELAGLVDAASACSVASGLAGEILGHSSQVLQPDAQGNWPTEQGYSPQDKALFSWVLAHGQKAGRGTSTLRDQRLSVWPLIGARKVLGVLVVERDQAVPERPGQEELIESLAASLASTLERVELIDESRTQALTVETERTRNALLHSLSHDLRTPLTIIAGSLETLQNLASDRLKASEGELLFSAVRETQWLGKQVENLLHLSRLTEVGVPWALQWVPADDPVLSAVERTRSLHPDWKIDQRIPDQLPLLRLEPGLIEQALFNFLENARDYAHGNGVELEVILLGKEIEYRVLDRGPGVSDQEKASIFEKFARGEVGRTSVSRGTGLGLSIVREVARIHGGMAGVEDRPGGGASFFLRIPLSEEQP
jgi:two-component system sensor histidine kinase KdpD